MEIFTLHTLANYHQGFLEAKDNEFPEEYIGFVGASIQGKWKPLGVKPCGEGPRLPPADFPTFFIPFVPLFNRKAVDALREFLEPNGEILPVKSPKGEYYVYNVTTMLDVFDREHSEYRVYPDGHSVEKVIHYKFFNSGLAGAVIFKIPEKDLGPIFVSDSFVRRAQEAGLIGMEFEKVYSTEDPDYNMQAVDDIRDIYTVLSPQSETIYKDRTIDHLRRINLRFETIHGADRQYRTLHKGMEIVLKIVEPLDEIDTLLFSQGGRTPPKRLHKIVVDQKVERFRYPELPETWKIVD